MDLKQVNGILARIENKLIRMRIADRDAQGTDDLDEDVDLDEEEEGCDCDDCDDCDCE